MTANEKQRQKKLAKKAADRKAKKAVRRALGTGFSTSTAHFTVGDCFVSRELFNSGIGHALFTRVLPNGNVALSSFLIDAFCLGVKNAMYREISYAEFIFYRAKIENHTPLESINPSCLKKLVEGAVRYASEIGFSPHHDYAKAAQLFGNINVADCANPYTFGKDGKPYYMNGPYETPAQQRNIIDTLTRKFGPKGFTYVLMLDDPENMDEMGEMGEMGEMDDDSIELPANNHLSILTYNVNDNPPEDSPVLKLPESVRLELDQIYYTLLKDPKLALTLILPMMQRYPDIPQLYNYLYNTYNLLHDQDNAQRILQETLERFPEYLFARIEQAHIYLKNNELDKIPAVFDGKFDLKLIYPQRTSFHRVEVLNFASIMARYFHAKGKLNQAEIYYKMMTQIDPDHDLTKNINQTIHSITDRIKDWFTSRARRMND